MNNTNNKKDEKLINWEMVALETRVEKIERNFYESQLNNVFEGVDYAVKFIIIMLIGLGFAASLYVWVSSVNEASDNMLNNTSEHRAPIESESLDTVAVLRIDEDKKPMSENRRLGLEVKAELMQDCVSFLAAQKYEGTANLTIQQCQLEGRNFMDGVRAYTSSQSKPETVK